MFDMKDARRNWEASPVFWIIAGVAVIAFLLIFGNFFFKLIGVAVAYAICFGMLGILLYIFDLNTTKKLGRRSNRLMLAVVIAVLWAAFRTTGLMSLAGHLILALWSFTVLFVSFSLGATIWKNRETIAQRVDEVAKGKASPIDAIREAAGATKASVKGGLADARKATTG